MLIKFFLNRILYKNVNLEIPLNQLSFIVGQSGSGKTTLINTIGGLDSINSGEIILETADQKIDLQKNKDPSLVDFVFQDFNLFSNLTVLNNLKVSMKILGLPWNKQQTIERLKSLDLGEELINSKVSELSGGEQQRLAIFRSLEKGSNILLVDEPTGNLDSENAAKIFRLLKEISKTKTVIVVSHDVENALLYADNIFELKNQKIETIKLSKSFKNIDPFFTNKEEKRKVSVLSKISLLPTFALGDLKKKKATFVLIMSNILILLLSLIFVFLFYGRVFDIDTNKLTSNNFDVGIIIKKQKTIDDGLPVDQFFTEEDNKLLNKDPRIKAVIDLTLQPQDAKLG